MQPAAPASEPRASCAYASRLARREPKSGGFCRFLAASHAPNKAKKAPRHRGARIARTCTVSEQPQPASNQPEAHAAIGGFPPPNPRCTRFLHWSSHYNPPMLCSPRHHGTTHSPAANSHGGPVTHFVPGPAPSIQSGHCASQKELPSRAFARCASPSPHHPHNTRDSIASPQPRLQNQPAVSRARRVQFTAHLAALLLPPASRPSADALTPPTAPTKDGEQEEGQHCERHGRRPHRHARPCLQAAQARGGELMPSPTIATPRVQVAWPCMRCAL
jgi:hypothetical protein